MVWKKISKVFFWGCQTLTRVKTQSCIFNHIKILLSMDYGTNYNTTAIRWEKAKTFYEMLLLTVLTSVLNSFWMDRRFLPGECDFGSCSVSSQTTMEPLIVPATTYFSSCDISAWLTISFGPTSWSTTADVSGLISVTVGLPWISDATRPFWDY